LEPISPNPGVTRRNDNNAMPEDKSLNWRTWRWETIGSYVLLAVILVAAVVFLGDELEDHVRSFEGWLAGLGPWALVMAVVLYAVFAAVFVPDTLLGLVAGATFGFTHGLIVALLGSLMAAIAEYLLSRRLLKPFIDRRLASKPDMQAIQAAVKTQELKLEFMIRLTPINRALTSYVLGASGVKFPGFMAALAGFLPHLCLEVYAGYAGKHLAVVTAQARSTAVLHDVLLVAGLLVTIAVIYQVSRIAKKAVDSAVESQGGQSHGQSHGGQSRDSDPG
jgi:uncharacterized membrane protein YdjX (TVP38/TMEM64 family)